MSYFRNAIGDIVSVNRANIAADDPTKLSFKISGSIRKVRVGEVWEYKSPSGKTYKGGVTQVTPVNDYGYYYVRINRNGVPFATVNGGVLTHVGSGAVAATPIAAPPLPETSVYYTDPVIQPAPPPPPPPEPVYYAPPPPPPPAALETTDPVITYTNPVHTPSAPDPNMGIPEPPPPTSGTGSAAEGLHSQEDEEVLVTPDGRVFGGTQQVQTQEVKPEDVVKYEDPMEASFAPAGMDIKKIGIFAAIGLVAAYLLKNKK